MNKLLASMALGAAALLQTPAPAHAADVGVSIAISQLGVYGRIDIGRYPQPEVWVPQPVIVRQPAYVVEPVYLWVPPGHRKNWSKHCARYNACGAPVYFVQDGWYDAHVMEGKPRKQKKDKGEKGHGKGHGKHDG